jgi:hypothetical protein
MRRYEQSIRVMTAFFAALLGFGLKNLLDGKGVPQEMAAPCFVLSVLLFLRFLIGSSNHCWCDYVLTDMDNNSMPANPLWVGMDLLILLLLGVLSAFSCYATTIEGFLAGHLIIVIIAIMWSILYFVLDRKSLSTGWRPVVVFWIFLNVIQILLIGAVWLDIEVIPWGSLPMPEWEWFPWPAWNINLTELIVCYFLVLCVDVYFGLNQLKGFIPRPVVRNAG